MKPLLSFHSGSDLHVWRAELKPGADTLRRLTAALDEAERERAGRLADPVAAARFSAARGLLREMLGAYLGIAPREVVLRRERHGKPCLEAPQPLHFNLSHAGDHLLLAFSPTARLGVDLERVRPLAHTERIARRAFAPDELRSWLALAEHERLAGFFERWTRMEALAKLLGHGVWRLLAEGGSAPGVSFHRLVAPPGSIAMLAVEEPDVRVLERHYPL